MDDQMMKVPESPNARVGDAFRLPASCEIRTIICEDDPTKQPKIALIFEGGLPHRYIAGVLPYVTDFQKKFTAAYGSDLNNDYKSFLLELIDLHQHGYSYLEISILLNFQAIAIMLMDEGEKKDQLGKSQFNPILLYMNLAAVGYSMEEYEEIVKSGIESMKTQILPWTLIDGPFSRERITSSIGNFKTAIKKGTLVIPPGYRFPNVDPLHLILYLSDRYQATINNLKNTNRDLWLKHEDLIVKWLTNLEIELKNSNNCIIPQGRKFESLTVLKT